MFYLFLKTSHIFFVVLALGTNLTYGFLLYLGREDSAKTLLMLNAIQWLDKNIANRSYILVLITGVTMVLIIDMPWTTSWIWISLSLFIFIALLGIFVYGPVLRRQVQLLKDGKFDSPEYKKVSGKSTLLGVTVTVLVIVILALMVFKPVYI